jgi:CheY-like chemotaxis protein
MKQQTIMLVEDDLDDQHLFNYCMQKNHKSSKCIIANNGKQAMDILSKLDALPDIIFMDVNMPLVDGYLCLKTIKKHERLCNIPVVMFSTAHKEYAEMTSLELGAAKFVQKPSDFNKFCDVIDEAIASLVKK